jgi:hypothetical protein
MTRTKRYLLRILAAMIIGFVISGIVSEASFRLLGNTTSRAPTNIELVIPKGTAEKVAKGETNLVGSITFVVGDILTIYNQDTVTHSLGPLVVPPGTSASLSLDTPENQRFSCSFNPSQFFGLDVRDATTTSTRIIGLLLAGIPLGFLLATYSLAAWPIKEKVTFEET